MKYWQWLFKGLRGGPAGIKRFYNRWLVLHISVGVVFAFLTPVPIYIAADSILTPLAVVLVGFIFIWTTTLQVLQSNRMAELFKAHPHSYDKYVCVYQTAILVFFVTLCAWIIGDLHIYDEVLGASFLCYLVKVLLFFMSSVTVRECWHLVLSVAKLSLINMKQDSELPDKHHE